jgi:hypothetical protein
MTIWIRLQLYEKNDFITINIFFGLCQLFAASPYLRTTYVPFLFFFHDKFGGKIASETMICGHWTWFAESKKDFIAYGECKYVTIILLML